MGGRAVLVTALRPATGETSTTGSARYDAEWKVGVRALLRRRARHATDSTAWTRLEHVL